MRWCIHARVFSYSGVARGTSGAVEGVKDTLAPDLVKSNADLLFWGKPCEIYVARAPYVATLRAPYYSLSGVQRGNLLS